MKPKAIVETLVGVVFLVGFFGGLGFALYKVFNGPVPAVLSVVLLAVLIGLMWLKARAKRALRGGDARPSLEKAPCSSYPHATGDDQPGPCLFFERAHFQHRFDGFLLGLADETAGVDDDGVGVFGAFDDDVAACQ